MTKSRWWSCRENNQHMKFFPFRPALPQKVICQSAQQPRISVCLRSEAELSLIKLMNYWTHDGLKVKPDEDWEEESLRLSQLLIKLLNSLCIWGTLSSSNTQKHSACVINIKAEKTALRLVSSCPTLQIHAAPDIKENSPLCQVMRLVSLFPSSRLRLQHGNESEWQVERGQWTRPRTRPHKESDSCVCRAGRQPENPPQSCQTFCGPEVVDHTVTAKVSHQSH